jgi:hypothetical protein
VDRYKWRPSVTYCNWINDLVNHSDSSQFTQLSTNLATMNKDDLLNLCSLSINTLS